MDDFTDDFEDGYDGGDDFTDETPEEEHADEGPIEHEIEEAQFEAPSWECIAFFGAMAEQMAEDEKIERDMKDEDELDRCNGQSNHYFQNFGNSLRKERK